MQILFILVSVSGLCYFFIKKRVFDLFTISFISSLVYFLPGFYGYTLYPFPTGKVPVNLLNETYLIMICVLLAIIIGGIIYDNFSNSSESKRVKLIGGDISTFFLLVIALIGFTLTLFTAGEKLFVTDKHVVMDALSRWVYLWTVSASLGLVLTFLEKRWKSFIIFSFLLLFHVYIGFRMAAAMSVISIFLIWLSSKGKQRFIVENFKISVAGLAAALFFFMYKPIYKATKEGNWELVKERISFEYLLHSINFSEPFTTQSILNKVVETEFSVSITHIFGVAYQFILFSPALGADIASTRFNTLFQPALFPGLNFGMANNIWAQMWSAGGWPLLVVFIFIFVIVIYMGSLLMRVSDYRIKSLVVLLMSYWTFYIHRNDIMTQVNISKRIFLIWFICVVLSILITKVVKKRINGISK